MRKDTLCHTCFILKMKIFKIFEDPFGDLRSVSFGPHTGFS